LCLNSECEEKTKSPAAIYCSSQCHATHSWALRTADFEKEQRITTVRPGTHPTNKTAKKYLIQKRGAACELCKRTEHVSQGKSHLIGLILDHIDGDSDNWKLSNLQLVCGSCDMLLPTYKSKNRNGRLTRRRAYRQLHYSQTKKGGKLESIQNTTQ
jgi:5-methylcytosine-specific restriction endonuclease McrA